MSIPIATSESKGGHRSDKHHSSSSSSSSGRSKEHKEKQAEFCRFFFLLLFFNSLRAQANYPLKILLMFYLLLTKALSHLAIAFADVIQSFPFRPFVLASSFFLNIRHIANVKLITPQIISLNVVLQYGNTCCGFLWVSSYLSNVILLPLLFFFLFQKALVK